MTALTHVHWFSLGERFSSETAGTLYALWPEPIDSDACFAGAGFDGFADTDAEWDSDFERLIQRLLASLEGYGAPDVRRARPATSRSWMAHVLDRIFRKHSESSPETPARILGASCHDDSLGSRVVTFGAPARAAVHASDGHPILWIWLDRPASTDWPTHLHQAADGRTTRETRLRFDDLVPPSLPFSLEHRRAGFCSHDVAKWTDGNQSFSFDAATLAEPPEVFIPHEDDWPSTVPAWAHDLRSKIVRDFETIGARVVLLPKSHI